MELWRLPASAIQELTAAGEVSPVEVVRSVLDRIDGVDGRVGAFLEVAGRERSRGPPGSNAPGRAANRRDRCSASRWR